MPKQYKRRDSPHRDAIEVLLLFRDQLVEKQGRRRTFATHWHEAKWNDVGLSIRVLEADQRNTQEGATEA